MRINDDSAGCYRYVGVDQNEYDIIFILYDVTCSQTYSVYYIIDVRIATSEYGTGRERVFVLYFF